MNVCPVEDEPVTSAFGRFLVSFFFPGGLSLLGSSALLA